jgi:indole-3-glycerol phosphate synthase
MSTGPTLDAIRAQKQSEVHALKERNRRMGGTTVMRALTGPKSLGAALKRAEAVVIPEIKRADPWHGTLRDELDAEAIARAIEGAGATTIAIQLDETYFRGEIDDLRSVARRTRLHILARDFVVDDAQLIHAKANGADAVMLMAALVEPDVLKRFIEFGDYIHLETIVEIGDAAEVDLAMKLDRKAVSIQTRDLRSQQVNLDLAIELRKRLPSEVLAIATGGVGSPDDVTRLREAGFDGVLVGTQLMRADDPAAEFLRLAGTGGK